MTLLTTMIFYFPKVINALTTQLTTPTPTPSLVKISRIEITFCSLGANHAKLDTKFENTAVFPALLCMFSGFRVLFIQKHFSIVLCLWSRCNYFCKPRRTFDLWERICLFFYKREWSRCSSFLVSEKLRVESAFALLKWCGGLSGRNGLQSMSAFNVCNVDVYRETGPVFSSPWAIYSRVKVIKQSVKVIKTKSEPKPSYISPRVALGKRPSITAYCSSCACATFSVSLIPSNSNFISS